MPEKVETSIVPSGVRCCLVLGRKLPDEMPPEVKKQFMSGLWDWAKKDDPKLGGLLSGPSATPVNFETLLVSSSNVDFKTASPAVVRQWMDQVVPTRSEPHYRLFAFPSHAMVRGDRYDYVLVVLVFGREKG